VAYNTPALKALPHVTGSTAALYEASLVLCQAVFSLCDEQPKNKKPTTSIKKYLIGYP
jgi:hypothetical protein